METARLSNSDAMLYCPVKDSKPSFAYQVWPANWYTHETEYT